ncbi:hypothetical protein [Sphingomonas sp.]|uniref:hypothetical protein n=1 Tax=Sphingomonas sp. TaxID=28214 RepID=UPI003B3B8E1F
MPSSAATPRELLTQAAFQTTDKAAALQLVNQALAAAQAQLAANPHDREAQMQRGVGIGDRARLTRSPGDAKTARQIFEAFLAANPRDPEAHLAIASWHLDTVESGFLATTMLGAKKDVGLAALDRAVALGGGRPFFSGFAAMMRIRLNPKDVATALHLAEQAAAAPAPTALDRIAKRQAQALLVPLRSGDGRTAQLLARKLLPFGRLA